MNPQSHRRYTPDSTDGPSDSTSESPFIRRLPAAARRFYERREIERERAGRDLTAAEIYAATGYSPRTQTRLTRVLETEGARVTRHPKRPTRIVIPGEKKAPSIGRDLLRVRSQNGHPSRVGVRGVASGSRSLDIYKSNMPPPPSHDAAMSQPQTKPRPTTGDEVRDVRKLCHDIGFDGHVAAALIRKHGPLTVRSMIERVECIPNVRCKPALVTAMCRKPFVPTDSQRDRAQMGFTRRKTAEKTAWQTFAGGVANEAKSPPKPSKVEPVDLTPEDLAASEAFLSSEFWQSMRPAVPPRVHKYGRR